MAVNLNPEFMQAHFGMRDHVLSRIHVKLDEVSNLIESTLRNLPGNAVGALIRREELCAKMARIVAFMVQIKNFLSDPRMVDNGSVMWTFERVSFVEELCANTMMILRERAAGYSMQDSFERMSLARRGD